jgi:hypothetical protein
MRDEEKNEGNNNPWTDFPNKKYLEKVVNAVGSEACMRLFINFPGN